MKATLTFNQLRKIKDSLPPGGIHAIAQKFHMEDETVRNYFGGSNYDRGTSAGIHIEQGPDGGIVELDDNMILGMANQMIYYRNRYLT